MTPKYLLVIIACLISNISFSGNDPDFDQFKKDREAFKGLIRSTLDLTEEENRSMYKKICTLALEDDVNDDESATKEIADRAKNNVQQQFDEAESFYKELLSTLDDLESRNTNSDYTNKLLKSNRQTVEDTWHSFRRIDAGFLLGSNHPAIKWKMEKGKEAHKWYQEKFCAVSEYKLQDAMGKKIFADCLVAEEYHRKYGQTSSCMVIEIKPENQKARELGNTQVDNYWTILTGDSKYYNDLKAKFSKCIEPSSAGTPNERLRLKKKVVTYDLCPSDVKATDDTLPKKYDRFNDFSKVRWR